MKDQILRILFYSLSINWPDPFWQRKKKKITKQSIQINSFSCSDDLWLLMNLLPTMFRKDFYIQRFLLFGRFPSDLQERLLTPYTLSNLYV